MNCIWLTLVSSTKLHMTASLCNAYYSLSNVCLKWMDSETPQNVWHEMVHNGAQNFKEPLWHVKIFTKANQSKTAQLNISEMHSADPWHSLKSRVLLSKCVWCAVEKKMQPKPKKKPIHFMCLRCWCFKISGRRSHKQAMWSDQRVEC